MVFSKYGLEICVSFHSTLGISFSLFWAQIVRSCKCLTAFNYSLHDISFQTALIQLNFKWILAENKGKKGAEYQNMKNIFLKNCRISKYARHLVLNIAY